jgi:hypothetical protein
MSQENDDGFTSSHRRKRTLFNSFYTLFHSIYRGFPKPVNGVAWQA